jgi:hypothetical protein
MILCGGDGKQTCQIWDLVGDPGQGQSPVPVRDWSAAFSLLGHPGRDNSHPRILEASRETPSNNHSSTSITRTHHRLGDFGRDPLRRVRPTIGW